MIEELRSLGEGMRERSLEAVFEALSEGVLVQDAAGEIIACNPVARRILGLPAAGGARALVSLTLEYLREDGSRLPPAEHPANVARHTGLPQGERVLGVRPNATSLVWIRANVRPVNDEHGTLAAVITTFADITAMKAAQDALRATEARSRTLAEAIVQSGSAVVITDQQGRIEYVNPACCRAYGYAADELVGAHPRIFKSGETDDEDYAQLWQTILHGEVWRGEMSNRSRDGRLIREAVSVAPVRDESGEIRHFVAVKEDITVLREEERRRHELFERVARLERMELVATLASGIAHDFNNVLVAILGYSELADAQLRQDGRLPRVSGYVDEIRIAGNRARVLIQQLLNFSRSGAVQPRMTRLDEVGREVVGLLRATLPDTVAVLCDIDRSLPPLSVDPAHVHQILMNLMINARDALSGAGTIRVSARQVERVVPHVCESCRREFTGQFVALEVADDGGGIAPEHWSRLFEPFFTTKEVGRGTGMGLPVVHGMAHQYDGHVEIQSPPGEGTLVRVLLPVALFYSGAAVN